jgi:hypothetical protein
LGLGVFVVGVVEQLAAGLAARPVDAGVAAAGVPMFLTTHAVGIVPLTEGEVNGQEELTRKEMGRTEFDR